MLNSTSIFRGGENDQGERNDFVDHYSEPQMKIDEEFERLFNRYESFDHQLQSILSQFSSNNIPDSIEDLHQFRLQSDQIGENIKILQQQFYHFIDQNKQKSTEQTITFQIQQFNENIQLLDLKLHQIRNNHHSNQRKGKNYIQLLFNQFRDIFIKKPQETPTLSQLIVKQMSPAILDLPTRQNSSENNDDDDDEMITYGDDATSKITHKVRFSNNIVRYLRGPFKTIVHGTMYAVDLCAQGTHISDTALQAARNGLERQQQIQINSIPPTFTEIGSDWIIEGENPDRGYSSPSIWMRDPNNRRILAKIQEHPLCAANEWLAFVLGKFLGLPVNEVQISVYQNSLVSLHLDVANEDEKTTSFMDLPKQQRKELLVDPIMERMDIFDRIIQNVDRNQQNILITYPKTMNIDDHDVKLRVHLIDHSNCFGMGKLNGISLVASKFHSHHLAVVKFDPIHKSKQFEQYLNKLPVEDRPLISKTLNRFSRITNEQFDYWINQISDLLSSSQYNRIYGVLNRQRDIAKRYFDQWGLSLKSISMKIDLIDQEEIILRL